MVLVVPGFVRSPGETDSSRLNHSKAAKIVRSCSQLGCDPCAPLDSALASFLQASRNRSTSAFVVVQPRLTRTAPRRSDGETPMAARTCEGCTLPDEQAAPDDTATPSRSKAIMAVSAFTPRERTGSYSAADRPLPENDGLRRDRPQGLPPEGPAAPAWGGFGGKLPPRRRCRRPEGGDPGHVLGAGARPAFLAAAADERIGEMDIVASPHQRADALRAADLVRRERQQIGAEQCRYRK